MAGYHQFQIAISFIAQLCLTDKKSWSHLIVNREHFCSSGCSIMPPGKNPNQHRRRLYYVELMTNISDAVDRSHLVPNIRNASSVQSIYDEGDNHRRGGVI